MTDRFDPKTTTVCCCANPVCLEKWLNDVYSLVYEGKPDAAIDVLFEHVDDLLLADNFPGCDDVLKTIDIKRLDTNLMVAVLSVTRRASDDLHERSAFCRRVEARLRTLDPERAGRGLLLLMADRIERGEHFKLEGK